MKLDELLYRTAPNFQAYCDEKSLDTRIRHLIVRLIRRRLRKANQKQATLGKFDVSIELLKVLRI